MEPGIELPPLNRAGRVWSAVEGQGVPSQPPVVEEPPEWADGRGGGVQDGAARAPQGEVEGHEWNQEPAFVAGENGSIGSEGGEEGTVCDGAVKERGEGDVEEGLGHRGGLEVEKVGVQGAEGGGGEGGGGGIKDPAGGGEEEDAAEDVAEGRRRGRRDPGPPPGIDAGEGNEEKMREREPRGAKLVVAGRSGIEDAAAGVEVRFCVAVEEEVTVGVEEVDRERAEGGKGNGNAREREGARTRCRL